MDTVNEFERVGSSECGCCHQSVDNAFETSCAERSKIFTAREMDVLQRIREHAEHARELRERIEKMNGHSETLSLKKSALDELERLRAERALLEEDRLAAAEERMRMLGYA